MNAPTLLHLNRYRISVSHPFGASRASSRDGMRLVLAAEVFEAESLSFLGKEPRQSRESRIIIAHLSF